MRAQRLGEQFLLVSEMVVEHAVGDTGRPRDRTHGQPRRARHRDHAFSGHDQVLTQAHRTVPQRRRLPRRHR